MSIIVAEAPGYLQVYSDGTIKRFAPEIAKASTTPTNGFKSKDVIINPLKPITARIFAPDSPVTSPDHRLPVVVYFHGGGFCIGSTTWLGYHIFLGDLSVTAQCIVLSVDYRLAPENRLPIAYEDCYSSLEWLASQVNSDPWLKQVDLTRVFLSGDSAGGNITHNVALKAIRSHSQACNNVKIKGLLLIHPYFGSQKRTEKEMTDGSEGAVASNDMFWRLSLPEGSNRDCSGCNFEMAELPINEFPCVVVYVAGLDFLKERGVMYAEYLRKKGVKKVELVEEEGESHVFHVFHPDSEATRLLQKQMSEFIKSL